MEFICILIENATDFFHIGLIDIMQQLVEALTWHHTGDRPLVEAVMTKILLPYGH